MPTHNNQLETVTQLDKHRFGGYFHPMFEAETVYCSMGDYADIEEVITAEFTHRWQAEREAIRMKDGERAYHDELREVMTDLSASVNDFPVLFKINNQIFTPKVDEDLQRGEISVPETVSDSIKVFVEVPRPTQANIRHLSVPTT